MTKTVDTIRKNFEEMTAEGAEDFELFATYEETRILLAAFDDAVSLIRVLVAHSHQPLSDDLVAMAGEWLSKLPPAEPSAAQGYRAIPPTCGCYTWTNGLGESGEHVCEIHAQRTGP